MGAKDRGELVDSSFDQPDNAAIGLSGISPLLDLSNLGTLGFNAIVTATNRQPRLKNMLFSRPVLQFCGSQAGCSGITANSHLRIASNFNFIANKNLTLLMVVGRANNNSNFLIANQSNGNNTGLFLGFTSGTNLRFGIAGPGGSPQINATIAAYSGFPTLELLTARIDTQTGSPNFGMQLLRNNILVASSLSPYQQAAATTIPFIGTQRQENNNSHFYFGELLIYDRALTDQELCPIHQFLSDKYELGLNLSC